MAKVNVHGGRACWNWSGARSGSGYGQFWDGERNIPAHWFLLDERPPKGCEACHRCDNKLCVRPSHIFIGTRSDNVRDCVSKGRLRPQNGHKAMLRVRNYNGSLNPQSKLTEGQVKEIRFTEQRHGVGAELARAYGVSQTVISGIRRGTRWNHATPN